jgi:hypothetical protein
LTQDNLAQNKMTQGVVSGPLGAQYQQNKTFIIAIRAFSGKVATGFPKKMRPNL